MKRPALTPEEKLWQQVWRVWPDAMQYEQIETPFEAPLRGKRQGSEQAAAWLHSKRHRLQGDLR
jgi:predicted transcriptional regulator YdeE